MARNRSQSAKMQGSTLPKGERPKKAKSSKMQGSTLPKGERPKKAKSSKKGKKKQNKPAETGVTVANTPSAELELTHPLGELTPSQAFFARYPGFTYDGNASVSLEFGRLCRHFGWQWDNPEKEEAFEAYRKALTIQFNDTYGVNVNGLQEWQGLCAAIGIDPIPTNMKGCRETVRNAHVNLVDLVDKANNGSEVTMFPSEKALSEYTKKTNKIFPKDRAHAGGLLKYLLRHIMFPRQDGAGV